MAKLNVLIHLQAFSDAVASNNPLQNNWKWGREISCLTGNNPKSDSFQVHPSATINYFNGFKSLAQDNTTNYSLSLVSGNTYSLAWVSGTKPGFALARTTTQDNTTQIQVTKNATLATYTRIAGTSLGAGSVVPGDMVEIQGPFSVLNEGLFKVLSATANSFTIENPDAVVETVTLSAASDLAFYSLNNIQKDDTLQLNQGFSPASLGNYTITKVTPDAIQFFSEKALPAETKQTEVSIFNAAKKFIYLETDQSIKLAINGNDPVTVDPFVVTGGTKPGIFMLNSTIYSLSIESNSLDVANIFLASIE